MIAYGIHDINGKLYSFRVRDKQEGVELSRYPWRSYNFNLLGQFVLLA